MFSTKSQFAQFIPEAVGTGQQWWRAVTLFGAPYWFQFTYELAHEGGKEHHTVMVFDEWTLLSLLIDTPAEARRSVCRFEREKSLRGGWTPRWLEAVWLPAPAEVEVTGVVLLKFEGEAFIRDAHMKRTEPHPGRTVLFGQL